MIRLSDVKIRLQYRWRVCSRWAKRSCSPGGEALRRLSDPLGYVLVRFESVRKLLPLWSGWWRPCTSTSTWQRPRS